MEMSTEMRELQKQVKESSGQRKGKNATGQGNPYLGGALGESAVDTGRTQTFPGTKYRRLVRRMPGEKPRAPSAEPSWSSVYELLSDPKPSTKTSAPTTTNGARTSAARSAATPAPSNGAATRSSSNPSNPASTPTSSPVTKASANRPLPSRGDAPRRQRLAACPLNVLFSDQDHDHPYITRSARTRYERQGRIAARYCR